MMLKTGAKIKLLATLMASLLVSGFMANTALAVNEVSRLVPFQGRLHATDNKAVADGVYDLTFNIYETPTGGTPAWTEAHTQVSVIHGYVNILLGAITPMHETNYADVTGTPAYDASKNNVDFTTKKYLGISINGGVEMFPRSQLVPSFHAFTANHADHATEADHALQADQASNAAKFNNQSASYYATVSGLGSSNSRVTALEGKFTGTKAKDADKLDGLDSIGFMRQALLGGYYGLAPNGSNSSYVRTTQSGLLPYQSGGSSYVGTSSWPFSKMYANDIYDNGTLLESKYLGISNKASDADKLDNLNSTDFLRNTGKAVNADKLDDLDSSAFYRIFANGSSSYDPNTTTTGYILTKHANAPSTAYYWHIKTSFWTSIGSAQAAQHAISYNATIPMSYIRHKYSNSWSAWVRTDNNGKSANSDNLDGVSSEGFAKVDYGVPVGSIMIWAQTSAPAGWVICDGTALSRTTHSKLYAVLGTKYGTSSSSNFKVPNYKGYFLRGWGGSGSIAPDEASRTGGNVVGSTQTGQFKSHYHGYTGVDGNGSPDGSGDSKTTGAVTSYPRHSELDYEGGNETRPVNIAVNYIIKL